MSYQKDIKTDQQHSRYLTEYSVKKREYCWSVLISFWFLPTRIKTFIRDNCHSCVSVMELNVVITRSNCLCCELRYYKVDQTRFNKNNWLPCLKASFRPNMVSKYNNWPYPNTFISPNEAKLINPVLRHGLYQTTD